MTADDFLDEHQWHEMMAAVFDRQSIGTDLAWVGAVIICIGVVVNSLVMDHILAMEIWQAGNCILLAWSIGLWRRWWDGGLAGAALVGMYIFNLVVNQVGLMHG